MSPGPGSRPVRAGSRPSARGTVMLALLAAFAAAGVQAADDQAAFFRQNCASCHTIGGGRLTGPDLKDVTSRKDTAWLVTYLRDPKAMIDSGDPYAAKLFKEARGVIMPTIPGMTPERASALLDLIAAESRLEHSQFAGVAISDAPFTAADVTRGKALFTGLARLGNGGPPCLSCHAARGVGGLGGGRLGPDLTRVFERLGGRRGLATWLSAPATTTMQGVFRARTLRPDEIAPLIAFLEAEAKAGGQADLAAQLDFFLLGLGSAVVALASFGALWRGRFRAVRRPLVRGARTRGES